MVHHCTREKNKPMTLPCNKQHVSPCPPSLDPLPVRATVVFPTGTACSRITSVAPVRNQNHSRMSRQTTMLAMRRKHLLTGTLETFQAARMHLQNDASVTVRTRQRHNQDLTFRLTYICARSRGHCLGLPPHVAASLLLFEPNIHHYASRT